MSQKTSQDDIQVLDASFLNICSKNKGYNALEHSIYDNIVEYSFIRRRGMKALGQNFLCDENLLDKIVKSAIPLNPETTVVEVGSGPCGLTRSIIKIFPNNRLICIEKDIKFKSLHDNILKHTNHNLKFIYDDALKYNLDFGKVAIIANLPYNVGTILLVKWLTQYINCIDRMVLLFQKEVAERICAKPETKQYGFVSILAQLLCNVELLFDISNKAFIPVPKVTSSLVLLIPKKNNSIFEGIDSEEFAKFVNKCFQFRRKIIYSTLKRLYPSTDIALLLLKAEIDKTQRPETISPDKFMKLFRYIWTSL